MKRFYRLVSIQSLPVGVRICLDAKPLRTPFGGELLAPNERVAALIQQEWAAQGDVIDPAQCAVTAYVNSAQDSRPDDRSAWIQEIDRYLETDLLAYLPDHPPELVTFEHARRDPLRDRVRRVTGYAVQTTTALSCRRQSDMLHRWVRQYASRLDPLRLAIMLDATRESGSALLGVLVMTGSLGLDEWMQAIFCEEDFYHAAPALAAYGFDPEGEHKRARLSGQFATMESIVRALGPAPA